MWCIVIKFSYESVDERILKIGPHMPKLLTTIKWLTFLSHSVVLLGLVLRMFVVFINCCLGFISSFGCSYMIYVLLSRHRSSLQRRYCLIWAIKMLSFKPGFEDCYWRVFEYCSMK